MAAVVMHPLKLRRQNRSLVMLIVSVLVLLAFMGHMCDTNFLSANSRRRDLLLGVTGATMATLPVAPATAAEFAFLGKPSGPFEVDPKEAVIVGDSESEQAKSAKEKVIALQQEAKTALTSISKDDQIDLTPMISRFGIANLREATNTINNLMDDQTAAGTQRLQRLMIQAKYQLEDDIPLPVSRKGVVQPRGPKRVQRIKVALQEYIDKSTELLKFI